MQSEKFQPVKLGIEEIPEYLRTLQEQTGRDIETFSFRQTGLADVVTPVEIVFRRRSEKNRTGTITELPTVCNDSAGEIEIIHPSRWKKCVQVTDDGDLSLIVACYALGGWLQCVEIPFSSFSQNLTTFADLERLVIDTVVRNEK